MIPRKLFDKLLAHLEKKEFSILTGARQTGKSTLLRQIETHCSEHRIPVVFLNLENKSILSVLNENPLNVLGYLPNINKRTIVLVDEVQYLDDPSNFLKLLYDEHVDKIKIVASGSSAFYLDSRFRDSLAGRKRIFQLFTCSFDEYLELSEKPELLLEKNRLSENPNSKSSKIDYLRVEWQNYLLFGGYPAVITESNADEKIVRLRELRDSFLKRDILESGVSNDKAFYSLMRIMASQTGNLVNVNELANTLRIQNSTVTNYLNVMQKCFHIALIRPFFKNLRKELVKMPKVYFMDTGMRNCLLENFQSPNIRYDKGEIWENMVFRQLIEKYNADSIHYWRTTSGQEVDFVLPGIANPKAIEAKFDKALIKKSKYRKFKETYPEIPLEYVWMAPFNEDFFRLGINC
jgi:predicted AAA+ superfamily ATPase